MPTWYRIWPLRNIRISSIPANVRCAQKKLLKPNIGLVMRFINRWSCSIILLRYLHWRSMTRLDSSLLYCRIAAVLGPLWSMLIKRGRLDLVCHTSQSLFSESVMQRVYRALQWEGRQSFHPAYPRPDSSTSTFLLLWYRFRRVSSEHLDCVSFYEIPSQAEARSESLNDESYCDRHWFLAPATSLRYIGNSTHRPNTSERSAKINSFLKCLPLKKSSPCELSCKPWI